MEAQVRQQLIVDGASPDETEKILDNFSQLWSSYDTLTENQKEAFGQAHLDEEDFFKRQPSP
jgi:hypothetical protein